MKTAHKIGGGIFLIAFFSAMLIWAGITYDGPVNGETANDYRAYGELPRLASAEQLQSLLEEHGYSSKGGMGYGYPDMMDDLMIVEEAERSSDGGAGGGASSASAPQANQSAAASQDSDYSELNVQVAGVDEADIIRTDGQYIYRVSRYEPRLDIIKALPADSMERVSGVRFTEDNFQPQELYVDGDQLVVIGMAWPESKTDNMRPLAPTLDDWWPGYDSSTCRILVYDLSALPELKETRRIELEGDYLSSRKIDDRVYVLSNKQLHGYLLEVGQNPNPWVLDTATSEGARQLDYAEICYFPIVAPNYLITAAFSLSQPERAVDIQTCLGGGNQVYASRDFLYVALNDYDRDQDQSKNMIADYSYSNQLTRIYRFALQDAGMIYAGAGSVFGHVLNQFSMDEYNGYFRIATTSGYAGATGEDISKNHVYVLDNELKRCGAVEDIAPGEKIYSARFMGDRAYMVTFRTVDPLFVLDLSDPSQPAILGQLKIPGYSDYLHPYDENHIIGFGKNSVTYKDNAYYQGMKIALFDVSDPANPLELCKTEIGDRGTESPLLQDHKALLFSSEKNLIAFPVKVMELSEAQRQSETAGGFPQYGQFTFQGAYVYRLDPVNGFTLEQRISHLSGEDYKKAGDNWYDSRKNIERILYIGDTLYTVSDVIVKAHDRQNAYAELGMLTMVNE